MDGSGWGNGSGAGDGWWDRNGNWYGDGAGSVGGNGDGDGSGYGLGSESRNGYKTEIRIINQNMDCLPLLIGAIVTAEGQQYLEQKLRSYK